MTGFALGPDFDAGKRASDTINMHLLADVGNVGWWVAIRLSDGGTDGVVYATKEDAVKHQLHEQQCAYFCIPPTGATPREAQRFIELNRNLYAAGARLTDPGDVRPTTTHEEAGIWRPTLWN